MSARVAIPRVETDLEDQVVTIKDVHIGHGGEARNVQISYDEVSRRLCFEVCGLGGVETLQKFYLVGGKILVANSKYELPVVTRDGRRLA